MSSLVALVARSAILACFVLSGAGALADSITVEDPRPVAKAVEELESKYGWQITYEDPPYVHGSDIADVTRSVRRDPSFAGGNRILIPKGGKLTFTVPSAPGGEQRVAAVEALVKTFNTSRNGNLFAVLKGSRFIHVTPQQIAGRAGKLEPVKPLLDTVITLPPKQRNSFELLEAICGQLSLVTKGQVVVGTAPVNLLATKNVSLGANNEPARAVLERLLLAQEKAMSWQLFYDPGLKWYVLNLHTVPGAGS
jgi:hypothetical protein